MAAVTVLPPPPSPANGNVAVMNNAELQAAIDKQTADLAQPSISPEKVTGLGGYIRQQYEIMRIHRDGANGWSQRLLSSLRAFNGVYDPDKFVEIQKHGGSEVYARVTAMKIRGASSLLRDVYLSADRPWGLEPPADPAIPPQILQAVIQKVQAEVKQVAAAQGQPDAPPMSSKDDVKDRTLQLMAAARDAAIVQDKKRVKIAEDKIETDLNEGNFYVALSEMIADIPMFPFGCLKGPEVKIVPEVTWENGHPIQKMKPVLWYQRVSPFDVWWTPGVSDIARAAVIERIRLTRAEINDCLDLPGYDHEAVRKVLEDYGRGGLVDSWDATDSQRAVLESRENPFWNRSGMITSYKFTGNVQGIMLLDHGFTKEEIPDPMRDYAIEGWMIGQYLIKAQLSPSPRRRHMYYITSFEKVPGTVTGNSLPDILRDVQEIANATLRALCNNLAIASGPQVVVNDDRLSGNETGEDLYPWKRWHVTSDPLANANQKPIEFFNPQSNSQELLGVFTSVVAMGDDQSAIPRYLQGNSPGGAGRTASGLAMLMGNASKILQTVAANIDRDVVGLALRAHLDMVLLSDTDQMLDGTEKITVKGVAVALQRETLRSRQLEFLQTTANPIDTQIMGPKGRAAVLRSVAGTIGLPGEDIVPSTEELMKQQQQAQQLAQSQGVPGHAGVADAAAKAQGEQAGAPTQDMGPRTNLVGQGGPPNGNQRIAGGVG